MCRTDLRIALRLSDRHCCREGMLVPWIWAFIRERNLSWELHRLASAGSFIALLQDSRRCPSLAAVSRT